MDEENGENKGKKVEAIFEKDKTLLSLRSLFSHDVISFAYLSP